MINRVHSYLHKLYSTSPFPIKAISQSQSSPGYLGVATGTDSPLLQLPGSGPTLSNSQLALLCISASFKFSCGLVKLLSLFSLISLFVVDPETFPTAMTAADAISLHLEFFPWPLYSFISSGLHCSSETQICFINFVRFQVSSAFLCSDPLACPDP